MATTKNTTRKTTAKKATPPVAETPVVEAAKETTAVESVAPAAAETLTQDTLVPVRCNLRNTAHVQDGVLIYKNDSTGARYIWNDFGDVCYIPFRELVNMKGKQSRFFTDGWISIDNYLDFTLAEAVITALGVEDTMGYMRNKKFDNITDILKISDVAELEKELRAMPNTLYPIIAKTAKEMVATGELRDINVLFAIRKVYPNFTF